MALKLTPDPNEDHYFPHNLIKQTYKTLKDEALREQHDASAGQVLLRQFKGQFPDLPRPPPFRRQYSEFRERLAPLRQTPDERSAMSARPHDSDDMSDLLILLKHQRKKCTGTCKVNKTLLLEAQPCDSFSLFDYSITDLKQQTSEDQLSPPETVLQPNRKFGTALMNKVSKIKRGLSGFVNGSRKSAIADTCAAQNVVSAAYVKELKLQMENSPSRIKLGNSKETRSIGTVSLMWAFAEKPAEVFNILCHVLPQCTYDLILGRGFLTATETMSKHRRRIVECAFLVASVFHLNFLGNDSQYLRGTLADKHKVYALPDIGAEANIIDKSYAIQYGLKIKTGRKHRGLVQFADESYEETVGQVITSWTFESGKRIQLTFEVLEKLCSDVIIGEDVLWEHNVFEDHVSSFQTFSSESESFMLAPFTFYNRWQQKWARNKTPNERPLTANALETQERNRRDLWHSQFGFDGVNANEAERDAEKDRRNQYRNELLRLQGQAPPAGSRSNIPRIPSIPSSSRQQVPPPRQPP